MDRGMPANLEAERLVLGSILLLHVDLNAISMTLSADDFSLEKHRRIYRRMLDLHSRGDSIDYGTVFNELEKHREAESCDGLTYLTDLTTGVPRILNLDSHVQIIQEKSTLRRTIGACQLFINRCLAEDGSSKDILADAEAVLAKLGEGRETHGHWLTPAEVIAKYPGGINAFFSPSRAGLGVATPWPSLTKSTCGLQKDDLVLVAARPSMGKSIVGMQLAYKAAQTGHGAAFFSLEMAKENLVSRLISGVALVDYQRLRSGNLSADERHRALLAASEIEGLPLRIDDTRARTIPAVSAALRKLRGLQSVRLVIIDHLQLMKSTGRAENRHHELSEISHALKHLAGDMAVTVVVLSQLNRECERERRRPQLSDLKETGSLEEDADLVFFIHRPERYDRDDPSLKGVTEFILAKQRNGPTGKLHMVFRPEYQRFDERAPEGTDED
jgi:replicative DNA helicase